MTAGSLFGANETSRLGSYRPRSFAAVTGRRRVSDLSLFLTRLRFAYRSPCDRVAAAAALIIRRARFIPETYASKCKRPLSGIFARRMELLHGIAWDRVEY